MPWLHYITKKIILRNVTVHKILSNILLEKKFT